MRLVAAKVKLPWAWFSPRAGVDAVNEPLNMAETTMSCKLNTKRTRLGPLKKIRSEQALP